MTDLSNLPPLPTGWHWEIVKQRHSKVAANNRVACPVWLDDDGYVVASPSAPAQVVIAVLKANGYLVS